MTDTQHCHACGKELPWDRIILNDQAYCTVDCMHELDTLETLSQLVELEASLTEALDALQRVMKALCGETPAKAFAEDLRGVVRLLARHGRFRITKDGDWTEGEWVE